MQTHALFIQTATYLSPKRTEHTLQKAAPRNQTGPDNSNNKPINNIDTKKPINNNVNINIIKPIFNIDNNKPINNNNHINTNKTIINI